MCQRVTLDHTGIDLFGFCYVVCLCSADKRATILVDQTRVYSLWGCQLKVGPEIITDLYNTECVEVSPAPPGEMPMTEGVMPPGWDQKSHPKGM